MKSTNFIINQKTFIRLLLKLKNNPQKGITLTELLVALVIGSIVLSASASGFTNLLRANQDVESKTVRSATSRKALTYLQEDIRRAKTVTQETATTSGNCKSSAIDSQECLVVNLPNGVKTNSASTTELNCATNPQVYYGYQDISSSYTGQFLKPGLLKRKRFCDDVAIGYWEVVADGLISGNEANQPTVTCSQDSVNWLGETTIYGTDSSNKGGFRFCLNDTSPNNTLARIFLSGYIPIGSNVNDFITVDTISFSRSTDNSSTSSTSSTSTSITPSTSSTSSSTSSNSSNSSASCTIPFSRGDSINNQEQLESTLISAGFTNFDIIEVSNGLNETTIGNVSLTGTVSCNTNIIITARF